MSITLKDGTVLPDIPSEVLASYPKLVIVSQKDSSGTVTYYAHATSEAVFFHYAYTVDNVTFIDSLLPIVTDTSGFTWAAGSYMAGTSTSWDIVTVNSVIAIQYTLNAELANGTYSELVWSNYDIMTVEEGSDGNPVQTGEVFFANCAKFILPDGTELPALPEGCFEKYPYGVVFAMGTNESSGHALVCSTSPVIYVTPEQMGADYGYAISNEIGNAMYSCVDGTWTLAGDDDNENFAVPIGVMGDTEYAIAWTNYDIVYATAFDTEAFIPTPGPDLYHKSDVNYRIYGGWLNSMGNQARRLGNVSGALKPGEMETVMKATTAGAPSVEGVYF